MNAQLILTLILYIAATYGLAFAAAILLVEVLGRPWRRAASAHWTERARLAFAPGFAVLLLAVSLPPPVALLGNVGLGMLNPRLEGRPLVFWLGILASFTGVLTVRYRWLRGLWGARVTVRSWLAGFLVIALALIPHLLVWGLLLFLLPETPNARGAVILGGGILAIAFFAWGGGVLLLRLLGVVRQAPPSVTKMVEGLAQKMKVPGPTKVLQVEWAQVNAIAWKGGRAVGFSRPLLELMTQEEVRAVAAHELAHLVEPRRVRAIRVVHMFAYLPTVLLIRYGGASGLLAGGLLFFAIMLGYVRFSRRQEQRADSLEREAIAEADAYMRSMSKLHEANLIPAVMPGTPTHPHLYDRLLAGGIQPEYPRPMAPSRTKPLLAVLVTVIVEVVLMFTMVTAALLVQRLTK